MTAIEKLWPGSWINANFDTWIGEPEETLAWDYLGRVRRHLARYDIQGREEASPEQLQAALDSMYLAEGSDWFWWYGSDQDSGVDEYFDEGFRALLRGVYVALGDDVPQFVDVPIIPERPVEPERAPQAAVDAVIDGRAGSGEWDNAGYYQVRGGAMARAQDQVSALYYGYNANGFVFRVDGRTQWSDFAADGVTIYFALPGQEYASPVSTDGTVLGFRAGYALRINPRTGAAVLETVNQYGEWGDTQLATQAAVRGRIIEAAVGLAVLPEVQPGDAVDLKAVMSDSSGSMAVVPESGPARMVVPDLGTATPVISVSDPVGDDHGPGSYTYPTDPVFAPGVFDITSFDVAYNDRNLVFTFGMNAEITNPWGSAIGLSLQTFDIYLDLDGQPTGASNLLEGRNAQLADGYGWDAAIWVEGWNQKILVPNDDGNPVELSGNPVRVVVDSANGIVSILVPRSIIEQSVSVTPLGQPEQWRYLGVVLSQDGYPSAGVRRVRDVEPTASQWRIGGGTGASTDTRIIDVALPEDSSNTQGVTQGVTQEEGLRSGLPMLGSGR